jgi:hypothetical protein
MLRKPDLTVLCFAWRLVRTPRFVVILYLPVERGGCACIEER